MRKEFDYHGFLRDLPIASGDIVDVASDLLSVLLFCRQRNLSFCADGLLDALKELVGENGTVLIRSFSWDFCHGVPFDIRNSPSRTGSLGNRAAARPDFIRTRHPIYSWWVWGKHQEALCSMDACGAFGKGGVFDYLYQNSGKQVGIGRIGSTALSQLHYAEVEMKVPYRREKYFSENYTDENGHTEPRTYSMHVRPFNINVTYENIEGEQTLNYMRDQGILVESLYEDTLPCLVFHLKEATDFFKRDFAENQGKRLVSVEGVPGIVNEDVDWARAVY